MPTRRALLAAALAAVPVAACATGTPLLARPIVVPELPAESALRLLGGLEIDDGVLGFGGLSGLHLAEDLTLSAVSDIGRFAEMRLALDAELRPTGLTKLRTGRLRDGAGNFLARGYAGDAESLARLPDGTWLVGFERWHRIRAYRDLDGPGGFVQAPPGLELAPANAGLETLAVLADGRWLAIAEQLPPGEEADVTTAWIGGPRRWQRFAYRAAPDHVPVDAAPLPGGGALVLERSFSLFRGFTGRLVRLPAAALAAPGAATVLEGEELLRLVPPLPTDNYEGVAAVRHAGRVLVALISDDNENRLQRTLLLLFELRG